MTVGGRRGLRIVLSNTSEATNRPESIAVFTTQLGNGNLFYAIGVAPSDTFASYRGLFDRIASSVQLLE